MSRTHDEINNYQDWRLIPWNLKPHIIQITPRAIIAGLFIGTIILISNFQFGLQTGWVSMMSLPSALLSFAIFKNLQPFLNLEFTDVENVFIQSIAVATGTGPLAYGFVGVIPAIEIFLQKDETGLNSTIKFSLIDLIIWSTGLAFFGIFFAIPLRNQVVVREKLPFPSGSATATLISVLNNSKIYNHHDENKIKIDDNDNGSQLLIGQSNDESNESTNLIESQDLKNFKLSKSYNDNIKSLIKTFTISSIYTILSYFFPILRNIPLFGSNLSENYLWNLQPSPAYIGQGIIMGLPTVSYMLFGCLLGWGILAPLAKFMEWAPGPIDDWKTGGQGWILWISLSVMVSDSIVSFIVVTIQSILKLYYYQKNNYQIVDDNDDTKISNNDDLNQIPQDQLIGMKIVIIGLISSSILCIITMIYLFGIEIIPIYSLIVAIIIALFLSILGVRALGETDLNPVSGIGKLSQLLFAFIIPKNHPGSVLVNLVAGAIAEAGAQQAGDLMQDLKTGHLLGASPKAQFIAQIIGTIWSIFLSSIMYKIYNLVYEIPNKIFRIPTAIIWIDCSRLVTGIGLPPMAFEFSIIFGIIFAIISILKNIYKNDEKFGKYLIWLPSGVAVGVGIYNTPSFTIARFLGGIIAYIWIKKIGIEGKTSMIVFSSGLVLGEGLFSIVNMILTSLNIPHF
ncbi:hypothetical protein WICMUC_001977 [Wickerhamomyces mucosus]|uniref:Oligopeptide transporter n=1 Tax=Wickerhamomyces mucosus TaxID=1378264 RepID=A0A9P8TFK5_9ASCO|nr:hypothetical protein WICMUC_001977 [Wickerhamomyces mucosus]